MSFASVGSNLLSETFGVILAIECVPMATFLKPPFIRVPYPTAVFSMLWYAADIELVPMPVERKTIDALGYAARMAEEDVNTPSPTPVTPS